MFRLYDINDNKEYGSFYQRFDANMPTDCSVLGKVCRSEAEWDALIAPYSGIQQRLCGSMSRRCYSRNTRDCVI
jgi:hypothetical protein